eukprot:TRINITY_DN3164_c0_g2_i3.p1 TRINITY_DN3164_c0_g2~~TRINITY_DN3164_c0_g2_i3.p1  ORF type:complete len:1104 (+),score=239.00 TRINITY_DN3164_c0_g2_i3:466-3777(+)
MPLARNKPVIERFITREFLCNLFGGYSPFQTTLFQTIIFFSCLAICIGVSLNITMIGEITYSMLFVLSVIITLYFFILRVIIKTIFLCLSKTTNEEKIKEDTVDEEKNCESHYKTKELDYEIEITDESRQLLASQLQPSDIPMLSLCRDTYELYQSVLFLAEQGRICRSMISHIFTIKEKKKAGMFCERMELQSFSLYFDNWTITQICLQSFIILGGVFTSLIVISAYPSSIYRVLLSIPLAFALFSFIYYPKPQASAFVTPDPSTVYLRIVVLLLLNLMWIVSFDYSYVLMVISLFEIANPLLIACVFVPPLKSLFGYIFELLLVIGLGLSHASTFKQSFWRFLWCTFGLIITNVGCTYLSVSIDLKVVIIASIVLILNSFSSSFNLKRDWFVLLTTISAFALSWFSIVLRKIEHLLFLHAGVTFFVALCIWISSFNSDKPRKKVSIIGQFFQFVNSRLISPYCLFFVMNHFESKLLFNNSFVGETVSIVFLARALLAPLFFPILGPSCLLVSYFLLTVDFAEIDILSTLSFPLFLFICSYSIHAISDYLGKRRYILAFRRLSLKPSFDGLLMMILRSQWHLFVASDVLSSLLFAPLLTFPSGNTYLFQTAPRPLRFFDHIEAYVDNSIGEHSTQNFDLELYKLGVKHISKEFKAWISNGTLGLRVAPGDFFLFHAVKQSYLVQVLERGLNHWSIQIRVAEAVGTTCQQRELGGLETVIALQNKRALSFSTLMETGLTCASLLRVDVPLPTYSVSRFIINQTFFLDYTSHGDFLINLLLSMIFIQLTPTGWKLLQKHDSFPLVPKFLNKLDSFYDRFKLPPEGQVIISSCLNGVCGSNNDCVDISIINKEYGAFLELVQKAALNSDTTPLVEVDECLPYALTAFTSVLEVFIHLISQRIVSSPAQSNDAEFGVQIGKILLGDLSGLENYGTFFKAEAFQSFLLVAVRLAFTVHMNMSICFVHPGELPESDFEIFEEACNDMILPETNKLFLKNFEEKAESINAVREGTYDEGKKPILLQYGFDQPKFSIFRLNGSAVRSQWALSLMDVIYFQNEMDERESIQMNFPTMRNFCSLTSDPPVGYPAYISPIIFSSNKDGDKEKK